MIGSIFKALERRKLRREEQQQRTIGGHMVWRDQPFFKSAVVAHGSIAGIPDIRLFVLQSIVRSLSKVPGEIAECGTRNGKSALFMLDAMEDSQSPERTMFLFDSFEGLSDPTPGRDPMKSVVDKATGERRFRVTDPQEVVDRFKGRNVQIMTGWIPTRFAEVANRRFALVHVDVDLYQPTHDSIELFYDRLEPYGILICDDYGSGYYPGSREAMDDFFSTRPEGIIELPQGQAMIVKQPG